MTTAPSPNNFFFFNDTATTEIYTLSLHDALPISLGRAAAPRARHRSLVADRNGLAGGSELCRPGDASRSEEHTSELQSQSNLVCHLLLEKKKHISSRKLDQMCSPTTYIHATHSTV